MRKREFCAKNRAEAARLLSKQRTIPETIEELPYWHFCFSLAGASHRNPDNTSRQRIIKQCKRLHQLILRREIGNRHDKHATQVLRSSGEIVGYIPRYTADELVENWDETPGGCSYSATVLEVEPLSDDGSLVTLKVLVFVALASADTTHVREYVAEQRKQYGNDLSLELLVPSKRLESQERPNYRERRKSPSKRERATGPNASTNRLGCLGNAVLMFGIVLLCSLLTGLALAL